MKKTKILKKRFIALILTTILCMASSLNVFAAANVSNTSDTTATGTSGTIEPRAIGSLIDSNGIVTSGYGGDFTIYLDRSYFNIYVRAGATGNENNAVACYVTFPNGRTYYLGAIVADGSKTSYLCYDGTAPAGNYTFHFEGTNSGTTGFLGFIYSSY